MNIWINGERREIEAACSIKDILVRTGYKDKLCAVAVNQVFVPRGQYAGYLLKQDDAIDIVIPAQGG